ncbi:MAG: ATP-binding cassette domain-containing protein [Lachnospiraceae bacterium]|nr:ATP-binding cassette domain-containing protein [Lachnospiraceae bacterium]
MNLYGENLKEIQNYEEAILKDALATLNEEISGQYKSTLSQDSSDKLCPVIDQLLEVMGIRKKWLPKKKLSFKDQLEYQLRPYGLMYRFSKPEGEWYKKDEGPMIAELNDGRLVLLRRHTYTYYYIDPDSRKKIFINPKTRDTVSGTLIRFYRALPDDPTKKRSMLLWLAREFRFREVIRIVMFTLGAVLCGALLPLISKTTLQVVSDREEKLDVFNAFFTFLILFFPFILIRFIFSVIKEKLIRNLSYRISGDVQAAFMIKLYSMPAGAVAKYPAGEIGHQIIQLGVLVNRIVSEALLIGLMGVLSLFYLSSVAGYAPELVAVTLFYVAIAAIINIYAARKKSEVSFENLEYRAESQGMTYSMIHGLQKLYLSGAETRGFVKWTETYKKGLKPKYRPPVSTVVVKPLTTAIFALCLMSSFRIADSLDLSRDSFYAYYLAFAMLIGAVTEMFNHMLAISEATPLLKLLTPIFMEDTETESDRVSINTLNGEVAMSKVTFQYSPDDRLILDNVSFKIKKGEYVAIVGKSGCGKSTLLRLLLGFERPVRGDVFYNNQPLHSLDLRSVRSKLGVVLQSSTVMRGTIEDNIKLNAPDATDDEIWEAVKLSGLEDDVLKLPLRLNTPLPLGGKGMSGGQIQKILIARAIVGKPKIMIFDEATSALDNISQKHISESLESLKCTRIVVAHRLSTVRKCDRILVLDGGKFVEEGSYDELMAKNGFFSELVKRQQVN